MNIDLLEKNLQSMKGAGGNLFMLEGHPTFGIGHLIVRGDPEFGKDVGTPVAFSRVKEVFEEDVATCIATARVYSKGGRYRRKCLRTCAFNLGGKLVSSKNDCLRRGRTVGLRGCRDFGQQMEQANSEPGQRISDRFLKLGVPH